LPPTLWRRRLGGLEGRRVVVLGAGKMGTLAVRSLTARGATEIIGCQPLARSRGSHCSPVLGRRD